MKLTLLFSLFSLFALEILVSPARAESFASQKEAHARIPHVIQIGVDAGFRICESAACIPQNLTHA